VHTEECEVLYIVMKKVLLKVCGYCWFIVPVTVWCYT